MASTKRRPVTAATTVVSLLLATTVGCTAPKARPQTQSARTASTGPRVAFPALEANAGSGPRLRGHCPVDLSLRQVSCPAPQTAVVEVVFSADGNVTSSRISRSSGLQALDLGCLLATNSCVVGQTPGKADLECAVRCE
jgi:hypothetical protein